MDKLSLGGGYFHGWKENGSEAPVKINLAEANGTGKWTTNVWPTMLAKILVKELWEYAESNNLDDNFNQDFGFAKSNKTHPSHNHFQSVYHNS